jgi:Fe-Mn family superoxide dismutase
MQRRKFIGHISKAGFAVAAAGSVTSLASCSSSKHTSTGPFTTSLDQVPLAYKYDALEPVIDAKTMEIHYTKHAAAYSTNLKDAVKAEGLGDKVSVEDILGKVSKYSTKMRNNSGGHYNHEMFWQSMKANGEGTPSGKLLADIETQFNSFGNFKSLFNDAGKNRFGSGWAWLYSDSQKKLHIGSTPNQDNPLMDVSDIKGFPILGLDVWEHAYYLKYQNKRADYIDNWWKVVNWEYVQKRYAAI